MKPRLRRRARPKRDPYTSERRSAIEILSRLAGRTCTDYTTLRNSGASKNAITDLDVAAAIASARDKLGSAMAMAIACQRPQEWDKVQRRAHPRFMSELRDQREMPDVVKEPHSFRARIALRDAFADLLFPARRPHLRVAAKDGHMAERVYAFLHRRAMAMLEAAANTAAADATRFLFAQYVEDRKITNPVVLTVDDEGEIHVLTAESVSRDLGTHPIDDVEQDLIDLLLAPPSLRTRLPGVLTLNGRVDAALVQPRSSDNGHSLEIVLTQSSLPT